MAEVISDAVRTLLPDHLTTFERLAVLLLLHKRAPEELSATTIGEQTHMKDDLVSEALKGLIAGGLIRAGPGGQAWRFVPPAADVAEAVAALSVAYCEQRAAIVSHMSVNAIGRIRSGPRSDAVLFEYETKVDDDRD